jgi:hypothetical protein
LRAVAVSPENKNTEHDVYSVLDKAFAPSARPSESEPGEPWAETADDGSRIEKPRPKTAGADETTAIDLDADPVSRGRGMNPRQPPDEPTTIERMLGRCILKPPPDLHAWIRKYGGYADITAEGWAEYNEAKRQWEEDRLAGPRGGAGPARCLPPAANETLPTDLPGPSGGNERSRSG